MSASPKGALTGAPLRVAMVAAMPFPTAQGTQALVGELARALAARGHEVHLVCYHHGAFRRDEPFAVHRTPPVPLYRRLRSGPDPLKPALDALVALETVRVVRQFGCQLLHAHGYEAALAGLWASRREGIPLVYHAHNLMADELPSYFADAFGAPIRLAGRLLDASIPCRADRVIALHEGLARTLHNDGVDAQRLHVVDPGIDARAFSEPGGVPNPPERALRVAYCGNIDGYQNLPLLWKALPRLEALVPGVRLVMAVPGRAEPVQRLVAAAGVANLVEIAPSCGLAEARAVLCSAAVAVCPRVVSSGFPIKNLNAAAAGVPIVACRGGAHGMQDGGSGLMVPDGDERALADALGALLLDPARASALGQTGQALVRDRYGVERMARGVEEVWRATLALAPTCKIAASGR